MRVLGIDPGLANTGFGIIDCSHGKFSLAGYGVIETDSTLSHEMRLLALYGRLSDVIKEFKPDCAEMETLYFSRNTSSAMAVAEAKGVITLCLAQAGIPLCFYTPNQIKYSVTGTKTADKRTVQNCVKLLLGLKEVPSPDHAADALAGAITCINSGDIAG
ncbi:MULTISPECIES: crossover junction endodeoxyribonuclease RuvC [Treponema]|uniref:Crossover junction endodeoxyribonuclease RuvC n=1 Tax=Treponema rectale TaxID=744512 RepID=A0A840S7H1_9SPIR|nr:MULTISPECIES: crossover junction endodeoxyribonuclease RuvC [Treponema]MBB5218539.1 crossover junction endodeoxyribonuclease RuvC [Treponema rectale]MBE6354092.1 crossover junction endodeoxyribonuclease RuvC [Treponema sp.]MBO6176381.1 crossover junction endodeoxyribonuclease RuvC [Treponema sp.]QOS39778.1 crossover junction endodeoxyribonuclease RuvC [Treponema rectale]